MSADKSRRLLPAIVLGAAVIIFEARHDDEEDHVLDAIRTIWLLMPGKAGEIAADEWVKGEYCALSFREAGEIRPGAETDEIRREIDVAYAHHPDGKRQRHITQLRQFLTVMKPGDWVVTPDSKRRRLHLGVVGEGPPTYTSYGDAFPRRRPMHWLLPDLDLDVLPQNARHTVGTIQPINKWRPEVEKLIRKHLPGVDTMPFPPAQTSTSVGVSYRQADEEAAPSPARASAPDPDLTTAAVRTHARLQNLLAREAQNRGLIAHSPTGDPEYDLAITDSAGGHLILAEVKSLPKGAETAQLRAGLAQLLHYADSFRERKDGVQLVLWVEGPPLDWEAWHRICHRAGVTLAWPGTEARIFGS
ncbi:hypothetical protein ACFWBN_24385 [Streptomyces sp. NPDC059989]|uniref:hypothetical protein n=1 Tax=Streptomyces sp. NPDC059989 TaxID=3347026 RepID=UPI0036C81F30